MDSNHAKLKDHRDQPPLDCQNDETLHLFNVQEQASSQNVRTH